MTVNDLIIRDLLDPDLPEVIELWSACGVSRPWNDPARDIAFARAGPHSTILVGVVGDRVVATTMVGEDGHRGWVYYVATHPEFHRRGIARRLMSAAEAWLRARGVWKMQLLIREDNLGARGFYERLGYADTRTVCFQKVISGEPGSSDAATPSA